MIPGSLHMEPLSSHGDFKSSLLDPKATLITSQEPRPRPRPQEQVRQDLPISVPTDKPAGYYLVLNRSRSLKSQPELKLVRSIPERKVDPRFAFGCLPNKILRAGPQCEQQPQDNSTSDTIVLPARKQPLPSNFGYHPSYERPPAFADYQKGQSTPILRSMTRVPVAPPFPPKLNPRGRYPDYELS